MLVWRYMDFNYGLKSILEARFKVANPLDLNDPFEMLGDVVGKLNEDVKAEMLRKYKPIWQKASAVSDSGLPLRSWPEVVRAIEENSTDILRRIVLERGSHDQRSRVLCFTKFQQDWDDRELLLWAHYADKGRGLRVLLDLDRDEKSFHISSVIYSNRRPILDLRSFRSWFDHDAFRQFFFDSVFTKSLVWSYEREVRLFTSVDRQGSRFFHEGSLDFISFDPRQIVAIDFGPKGIIEETREAASVVKASPKLRHVECRIATYDSCEYGYRYCPIVV